MCRASVPATNGRRAQANQVGDAARQQVHLTDRDIAAGRQYLDARRGGGRAENGDQILEIAAPPFGGGLGRFGAAGFGRVAIGRLCEQGTPADRTYEAARPFGGVEAELTSAANDLHPDPPPVYPARPRRAG